MEMEKDVIIVFKEDIDYIKINKKDKSTYYVRLTNGKSWICEKVEREEILKYKLTLAKR